MSIQSEIERINNNVQSTLSTIAATGVSVGSNSDALPAAAAALANEKLSLSGGTMTGPLVLAADPTEDMQAATKKYVDDLVAQGGGSEQQHTAGTDDLEADVSALSEGVFYWVYEAAGALPSDYTALEYIESTGTQYINTGFKPNQDTRVVMDAHVLSVPSETHLGSVTDGTYYWTLFINTSDKLGSRYGTASYQVFAVGAPAWNQRLTLDKNKNVTTAGGYSVTASTATFSISYPLWLFGRNTSGTLYGGANMRLYSCQIYDNGTLVRDYVPCKNAAGVCGLYDLENGVFYANAGTGSFSAGPTLEVAQDEAHNYGQAEVKPGVTALNDGVYYWVYE